MEQNLKNELENLAGKISEKQADLNRALETKASNEQILEVKSEITSLNNAMIQIGESLSKMEKAKSEKEASKKDGVTHLMDAYKSKSEIKDIKAGERRNFNLETKATITTADIVDNDYWGARLSGIGEKPYRKPILETIFNSGAVSDGNGDTLIFADQNNVTRGAASVDNCATNYGALSDIDWITRRMPFIKIGDTMKVCRDTMDDFSFVESEVRNVLLTAVQQEVERQILLGNGTTELTGVDTLSTAFAAGSFASLIPNANIFDLVHVIQTQIAIAGGPGKYQANYVLMNPVDTTILLSTKDADGNYVIPPFATENGRLINGVRIIESTLIPANSMYVMDSAFGTVYNRKGLGLEIATQNEDDWKKDLVAFKAFRRLAFLVRNLDYGAFIKVSNITTAITAINKP